MVTVNKQNNIQLINNFLNQSIMKKSLFAILAVAACFASCSEVVDSPVVDNPISFDNYVGKDAVTRAAVVSDVKSVNVNAYLHKRAGVEGGTEKGEGFKANFMSAQKVVRTGEGTSASWEYEPVKYWPASDQVVDFVAWIDDTSDPAKSNIEIVKNTANQYTSTLNFAVADTVDLQTDLLVADPVLDQNRAGDNAPINLHFKHLLSRIGFQIVATGVPGETDETTIVELNNITLSGKFATEGTVNMVSPSVKIEGTPTDNVEYHLSGVHFGWTPGEKVNVIRKGISDNTPSSYLMLIPTGAEPSKINVTYTVKTMDDNGEISGDPIVNSADFSLEDVEYLPGKAYKYIFYITMEGITFDVVVDEWDEQPSQGLNPEDGSWVTVELSDKTKIYYKGNLQLGSIIYVDGTGENAGKKVPSTKATYTLPDGRTIEVGDNGKVTKIVTPETPAA